MKLEKTERFKRLPPEKRQRILAAAVREFAEKGYSRASMNRVVEDAGISKGALFQYFGSKAGLFIHVYRMAFDLVKATLKAVREETREESFFDTIERLMRAGLRFIREQPALARVYHHLLYTGDSPFKDEILTELNRESHRFLQSLVAQGIERGELRREIDPAVAAFVLQSALDRFLQAHNLSFMSISTTPLGDSENKERSLISEMVLLLRIGMENRCCQEAH